MKLVSVNAAKLRQLSYRGRPVTTGIFKEPLKGPVMVRQLGLEDDRQADLTVHGGIHKALYAYPVEHYADWVRELDRDDLSFGQFGENLTVEGVTEDKVHIGDVFRIGGAVVQVTQPRLPCYKLALKMGTMKFPKLFLASGRVGYYLRVLEAGQVGTGDMIQRVTEDPARMSIHEIVRLALVDHDNIEAIQRALAIPALSPEWQYMMQERLAKV